MYINIIEVWLLQILYYVHGSPGEHNIDKTLSYYINNNYSIITSI